MIFGRAGIERAELGLEVGQIVVLPDALGPAAVADAGDHGGVVLLVRQDDRAGQQLLQGGKRGVVGDIGRGEEQRRRLAVQVGELGLQLDVVVRGAGDIARAAGAGAGHIERRVHGSEHGGVLAHAQIVVGAPHGDGLGAASGEAAGGRKLAAVATDVGEHPVAPLIAQRLQRLGERTHVIHQETSRTLGGFPSPGVAVMGGYSRAILDELQAAETPALCRTTADHRVLNTLEWGPVDQSNGVRAIHLTHGQF